MDYTVKSIYEILLKKYGNMQTRAFFITRSMSSYGKLGGVLFALEGSPPKGYAVLFCNAEYEGNNGDLHFFDHLGKEFKQRMGGSREIRYPDKILDLDNYKDGKNIL